MVELMRKNDLEKAYLETTYSVFIDHNQYDIQIGKAVPAIINELLDNKKSAVIITAWNPRSQALSTEENKQRNHKLYSNLKEDQYIIYNAVGRGIENSWTAEESFLILGMSKEKAEQLATEFEQYAYVRCEREKPVSLIFTKLW